MAQPSNATGVMDPQNRSLPSVFTPGNTQEAVMQGGPQVTDAPTGVVYAPLVAQIADSAGANIAGVDSSHNQLVKVNAALPAGTNAIGHVILDANSIATYCFAITGLAPAASATDILVIGGSASKVIRVTRIAISASTNSAVAATNDVQLIFRSGGTQSAGTAGTPVLYDTNDPAVTATIYTYTSNAASLGTSLGIIYSAKLTPTLSPYTATDFPTQAPIVVQFGITDSKPVVLRGTTQFLAVNLNGASMTGTASVDLAIEWTEAAS